MPEFILAKIDAALALDDQRELRLAVEGIVSDLRSIPDGTNTAEVNYLLGYMWYVHPDRQSSKQIQEATDQALLAAISMNPDKALGWLYLGHNAYDIGDYESALKRFHRVDLARLSQYLGAKTQEMILCCNIRLLGLSRCLRELDQFVSAAEEIEVQDLWPKELARVLSEGSHEIGEFDRARVSAVAHRLDEVGKFGDWFSSLV